jgi:hypothetical protein
MIPYIIENNNMICMIVLSGTTNFDNPKRGLILNIYLSYDHTMSLIKQ